MKTDKYALARGKEKMRIEVSEEILSKLTEEAQLKKISVEDLIVDKLKAMVDAEPGLKDRVYRNKLKNDAHTN